MTKRTDQQRKAIEVYCRELAEALNDGGYSVNAVMKVKKMEVPWTQDMVKELLFKHAMMTMYGHTSTKDLKIDEVDKVYRTVDRHMNEYFHVSVEFPSEEYLQRLEADRKFYEE